MKIFDVVIQCLKPLMLVCVVFAESNAAATTFTEEWRVLGPSFSYHSSTEIAQLKKEKLPTFTCRQGTYIPPGQTANDGEKLGIPSNVCSEDWASRLDQILAGNLDWKCDFPFPPTNAWYVSVCKFNPSADVREWHSYNPGVGLQYTRRYDDHLMKVFGSAVVDSYGSNSFMFGAAYMYPWLDSNSFTVDGGIVGGFWNRTTLNTDTNELDRRTMPFVFPGIAVTEKKTGIGFDLGFAPPISFSIGGRRYSMPATVMLQFNWLIKKEAKKSKQMAIQPTASGLTMSYITVF